MKRRISRRMFLSKLHLCALKLLQLRFSKQAKMRSSRKHESRSGFGQDSAHRRTPRQPWDVSLSGLMHILTSILDAQQLN
jgi:hypothetical protein